MDVMGKLVMIVKVMLFLAGIVLVRLFDTFFFNACTGGTN